MNEKYLFRYKHSIVNRSISDAAEYELMTSQIKLFFTVIQIESVFNRKCIGKIYFDNVFYIMYSINNSGIFLAMNLTTKMICGLVKKKRTVKEVV